jgi:hypothetical protein
VFLAALLSWIVFLTFDGETQQIVPPALDRKRHARPPNGRSGWTV